MTINVAALSPKSNYGVIASDSMLTVGDVRGRNLRNFSKVIDFPFFYCGFAGDFSIFPVIRDFALERAYIRKLHMRMTNQKDALKFGKDVFEVFKSNLESSPLFSPEKDNEYAELIILARGGLYRLGPDISVSEYDKFVTIGSGSDFACGSLDIMYPEIQSDSDLMEAVCRSVQCACDNSIYCGPPIIVKELRW